MSPISSFSQFLLDSYEQRRLDFRLRSKWMIRLRWLYIVMLPGVAIVAVLVANDSRTYIRTYLTVMLVGLALNGLLWLNTVSTSASLRTYQAGALLQILLDLLLASVVIYAGEGADSRAVALYAIPIVVSGVLFQRPAAYITAAMSGISYIVVILVYPLLNHVGGDLRIIMSPAIFFPLFFMLLAAITTRFSAINAMNQREQTYQQLLSMLRHQLHHPSSVMAAIVEMLEFSDNYKNWPTKDKEYLRQLKRENLRLNSMITNLLEAVSEKTGTTLSHPEKADLLTMLNESAISCATGAKRLNDLKTNLPNESIEYDCRPLQLRTAFDNILENAFRYSEKGDAVTVGMSRSKETGIITIKIKDQGPGISKIDQQELFKLFTRLEERYGVDDKKESQKLYSAGLGLYVSKLIIEQHHGSMELESSEGKGTSIIIKLQEALWLRPEFYT